MKHQLKRAPSGCSWILLGLLPMLSSPTLGQRLEEVIVEGRRERPPSTTARPVSELEGEALRRRIGSTLGETLANEPGVNNASFGPGVGLPVIRGLSGVRVRVMEDDIGAWDASSLGPDHASSIEAVLAERIRIVRGPAALTYGNSAIGGVVAVETKRIPRQPAGAPLEGFFEQRKELLNDDRRSTSAIKLGGGSDRIALHADAFLREQNDTAIPGLAIDEAAVIEQFGVRPESNSDGFLANTHARAKGGAFGFALFGDDFSAGASYGEVRNNYGIPLGGHTDGAHVHLPGGEEGGTDHAVRIDLQQSRWDMKAEWQLRRGMLDTINFRIGKIDYRHQELEEGVKGTIFTNEVTEYRIEFLQTRGDVLSGTAGAQHVDRQFSALGTEAFVPLSTLRSTGVWLVERAAFQRWQWEFGMRAERQRIEQKHPAPTLSGIQVMRTPMEHTTYNTLLAAEYRWHDGIVLSAALSSAQRAPDIPELLSLGAHHATRTFDIGDPRLKQEHFYNLDLGLNWQTVLFSLQVDLFANRARDFIYQENTGFFYDTAERLMRINCVRLEECMPVQRYVQQDARFYGYELEWRSRAFALGGNEWTISVLSDYVRGRLEQGGDIPRLPPLRYGMRFNATRGQWTGDLQLSRVSAQRHPGENETPSTGYVDVDASIDYHWPISSTIASTISLRARNLLNREIRNSASFLRNYAPEPGRSLELGFNVSF